MPRRRRRERGQDNSLLYVALTLAVVFIGPNLISDVPRVMYTIGLEGSSVVARDSSGNIAATSSDFGAAWNTLNAKLISGDSVSIKGGTYTVTTTAVIGTSKSQITLIGESGVLLKKSSVNTDNLMKIYGSHNTVKNIAFDDGMVGGVSGSVILLGSYNTLQSCTLQNCRRYGFGTLAADHFSILDCTVTKAQYGIAGMVAGNNPIGFSNGVIRGNVISGCDQAGIKMKMWKNVLVTNNHVDVGNPYASPAEGCFGIWFYHYDAPTQDVTVSDNIIVDSVKQSGRGIGIMVDPDDPQEWYDCPHSAYGMKILHNKVSVPFYNMVIKGDGCQVDFNDCSVGGVIDVLGNNNVLIGNLGNVSNSGSWNVISGGD
jgi:hypothetical protein